MYNIQYPYIPIDKTIRYVPKDNTFLLQAKEFARKWSLDSTMPCATVVVKDGEIIGCGANGSNYHTLFGCERVRQGYGSGKGYELCKGCNPKNHSVPTALKRAKKNEYYTEGADIYMWGDWFFCESCWNAIITAGIKDVYLMEESEVLFHKEHPDNVIGRQFEN